ncbi:MAG: bifunctional diguanylate cyclase/phosphodiesterase [Oceanospirillaceae bacterium]
MNLAKRASLLILPVVIVSYAVIGWVIYEREHSAIEKIEQNRLTQQADHLKFSYATYNNFIVAYLTSLIEGDALSPYVSDSSNIYLEKMLTNHLKSAVNRFEEERQIFASLSIIDSKNKVILYIENSTDPFAEIGQEQRYLAQQMAKLKQLQTSQHAIMEGTSIIQLGTTVDLRTLTAPIKFEQQSTARIVIAVKPARYDELLLQVKHEYDANIRYSKTKLTEHELTQDFFIQVKLSKDHFLVIEPSSYYLKDQLQQIKIRLALIILLSVLFTFTILQCLIRSFITRPIELLDRQLTDVIARQKDNIEFSNSQDEVGRLGRKLHSLYSALNSAFQESYAQARIDSLTQLANRVAFNEAAMSALISAKKLNNELSIVYIDIDDFKFVNDKYGHEVGDDLLKSLAKKFKSLVPNPGLKPNDFQVYRLSGDEFIILLTNQNSQSAQHIGSKVLQLFTNGFELENRRLAVSASIGIASFPADGMRISQLVSNADLAMYQAKKSGRNRVAVYSNELAKDDRKLKEIEKLLQDVNPDKEFTLYYMPIIESNGEFKGCEALLRWHSPHIGHISPETFIPIGEESGVFEMIDMWVIEQAFKDFIPIQQLWPEAINISVNISSAELNSDRFIVQLKELCSRYSIPANSFTLEITETFAMEQGVNAIQWLEQIRQLGFQIAIDDFGTGYTSLMQMVDYPVDIIKFDKQLIARITQTGREQLANALIDLCHLQGTTVVAEGVETLTQSQYLTRVNCDFQQGFFIAKPMPFNKLKIWLEKNESKRQTTLMLKETEKLL